MAATEPEDCGGETVTDWIQKAAEEIAAIPPRWQHARCGGKGCATCEWQGSAPMLLPSQIAAIIQRHVPAPAEEPVKACPVVCVVLPDGHDVPHYWVDPTRPIPPAPSNEPPEES
jgi:Na+-translocating ferredoxin:NAD+ oxidoreductase RNF subunit RnfB